MSDVTRNYHGGNAQSVAAHDSVRQAKDVLRAKVVSYVASRGPSGATCDEVEVALQLSHQTCSARFTEAKARGTLVPSGTQRKTRSGRNAAVLVVP